VLLIVIVQVWLLLLLLHIHVLVLIPPELRVIVKHGTRSLYGRLEGRSWRVVLLDNPFDRERSIILI